MNDGVAKLIAINNPNEFCLVVPITKEMISDGYVRLDFEFLNPMSPIEMGLSADDNRLLGIGLISAKFH